MQKEALRNFLFFGPTSEQVKILEDFLNILANRETFYFLDLDGTITNSPEKMIKLYNADLKEFYKENGNHNGYRKYRVIDFDRYEAILYWSRENGMSESRAKNNEGHWYEHEPLLASNPYLLAMPIVKKLVDFVGEEKVKTLTARKPHLAEATRQWHQRWFPFIKQKNILMRKDENINSVDFKVREVIKEAMRNPKAPVVVIDDSEENVGAIMNHADNLGLKNVYCVLMPLGQTKPNLRHERVLTLRRDPVEIQDINSLFEVTMASVAQ